MSFISKHNILYHHQYGFQPGKATELAINHLLANIIESFENKKKTIGNTESTPEVIKCGVPQGSILGPLLFLLYINDITKSSNILKFLSCLSYSYEHNQSLATLLNTELQKISHWLLANRLSINVDKSNYLLFSTGKKQNKLRLHMNKEVSQETASTKYLGIIIDKISGNHH